MVEDRLSNSLINKGYRRIDSNSQGIYLFYHTEGNELNVVSVIQVISGTELTQAQYKHILEQIKGNFINSYSERLQLLSLVLTEHPDGVKHLCSEADEDGHWIVDTSYKRLIIYETQPVEFAGLRETLEQLLEEEQRQGRMENNSLNDSDERQEYNPEYHQENMQGNTPSKLNIFTLMNTIIVLINVIAFLIQHYSGAFGGEVQMLSDGALSWYFVKEENEYYRLLTSMFMHSDWSHLINNMIVLLFVGDNLERSTGKFKYLFIYFGSGILAGITSISYNMWKDAAEFSFEYSAFSIGASGAIFGVVGAMLYIVIVNRGRIENLNTRQMVLFVVFSLYGGILNARIDQAAHVGGFIAGLLLAALLYRRPKTKSTPIEVG
jgi:rhomboid protease GluP